MFRHSAVSYFRSLACIASLGTLLTAAVVTAEDTPAPAPAQISYQQFNGKPIGHIEVIVRDIFDEPEIGSLYQTINKVKVNTHQEVILRELLIHEGDPFDDFRLRESERNLRQLGFIREVQITPKDRGATVDLEVSVQDTWTLIPQFSYSSGTGRKKRSAGIAESDLLGRGKRLEAAVEEDDNRRSIQGVYEDDRFWGTQKRLLAAHLERSDGNRSVFSFGRPFRSLVEKRSWSFNSDTSNTLGRLFKNGDERFVYRQKRSDLSARYTFAHGDPKVSVGRYTIGYSYQEDRFSSATENDYEDLDVDPATVSQDPALLADNRRFSGPRIGYTQIEPDYISMNYIDRFDRVEDYNLGNEFTVNAFFAPEVFGSDGDQIIFDANDAIGYRFDRGSFIRGEIGGATRYGSDGMTNSLIRTEVRYYNVLGLLSLGNVNLGRHTLAAGFSTDIGIDLDRDREFLLGADSGLRGYEARTFAGDKRLILNLEDRIHIVDDAFHLVSFGAAVFLDAGGTTNGAYGDIFGHNFYSNVGVGLRVAFPRSTGSRVLRADVSFPMRDGPDGADAWSPRFIISGGQLFDSHLRSETEGAESANIAVGFDR